ncbi:hypothetical protein U1Q18_020895 [Sarracenia purpurea var. burkii]
MRGLYLMRAFKNFSMSQKEKTFEEIVRDQWLCSTSCDNIGLVLRSSLDLRSWFHQNDIPQIENAGIDNKSYAPNSTIKENDKEKNAADVDRQVPDDVEELCVESIFIAKEVVKPLEAAIVAMAQSNSNRKSKLGNPRVLTRSRWRRRIEETMCRL